MFGFLYWEQGIELLYAISAVVAFIGCTKVYIEFNSDSDETGKVALISQTVRYHLMKEDYLQMRIGYEYPQGII